MGLPFGIILSALSIVSLIWGLACSVIGGIMRFNFASYINQYVEDLDVDMYAERSEKMIMAGKDFDEVELGSGHSIIGVLALLAGVLVIAYSLVGIAAGILRNSTFLFLQVGCILVSTILQFAVIWMIGDSSNSFHESAKDDLVSKIESDYELGPASNTFSQIMNSIMLTGHCCGVKGPSDFTNLTYTHSGEEYLFLLSPACCKQSVWMKAASNVDILLNCATRKTREAYEDGCYDTLFDEASAGSMGTYMILIIVIVLWQCVCMALAGLLLLNPGDDDNKDGRGSAGAAAEQDQPEPEVKIFTPFSKLSSYQSSDINRIKSTEIW